MAMSVGTQTFSRRATTQSPVSIVEDVVGLKRPPGGQSPAAPFATLTWLLVDRQLTVGRMHRTPHGPCAAWLSRSHLIVALRGSGLSRVPAMCSTAL